GYYTPKEIADTLVKWAIRTKEDTVLESSFGGGVFLKSTVERLQNLEQSKDNILTQLQGIELIPNEVTSLKHYLQDTFLLDNQNILKNTLVCNDYFSWYQNHSTQQYDCVVGNPPFIRYHHFPEPSRSYAMTMMQQNGLKPNKLTNIWVPFIVGGITQLKPNGRLAMVVPAELLQVGYAKQLRIFLVQNFEEIHIIACNQMFFEKAQQEVVLVLADKKRTTSNPHTLASINLMDTEDVEALKAKVPTLRTGPGYLKKVDNVKEKWLKYFLSNKEIGLMRKLRDEKIVTNFEEHALVNVGIVTGKNAYFMCSKEEVERYDLQEHILPIIGRTHQLKGAKIDKESFEKLVADGQKTYLFYTKKQLNGLTSEKTYQYIQEGEKLGVPKGYKCRIRKIWYAVPSVWIPDAFLFRQIYDFPRLVQNNCEATCTDTIHRVKFRSNKNLVLSNFYTHLTAASAEIEGRSYGGGVLELEPSEARRLLIPKHLTSGFDIEEIDAFIKAGKLEDLLKENDKQILMNHLGLSQEDCNILARIWTKLRDRRRNRKKRKK
ncbi:MAG: Eco57I restriction-modification methylase domain-containing protein, partial [Chitinophagales bacterium]